MKHSFVLLVIAIVGLLLPVFAQDETPNHQATEKACVAESHSSTTLVLIKDEELRGNGNTAPGAEKPQGCLAALCESQAEADDRSYLLETASSSATMTRQGPETAIARLNPKFVARLASAIREARGSGLPSAGISSAYRPPAFGVGRFLDKFQSLHAYGLAVDMIGIGEPASKEAKLWYEIAERRGIFCPYGVDSKREWNHCQATPIKAVCPDNPLRKTITVEGPGDLEEMFKVGNWFVDNSPAATCIAVVANRPADSEAVLLHKAPATSVAASTRSDRKHLHEARNVAGHAFTRARRWSDEELMSMVAADLRLGDSRPKTRRPR